MKKAYIILADGFEIIEAMTPFDVLTRCDISVKLISIGELKVKTSQNIFVAAHEKLIPTNILDGDMIILPGGYPGFVNLSQDEVLGEVLKDYNHRDALIGAICGAPLVLAKNDIMKGKKLTAHPSIKDKLVDYKYLDENVVQDGNLITGIGAGQSLPFALKLAENLVSQEILNQVKKDMEIF